MLPRQALAFDGISRARRVDWGAADEMSQGQLGRIEGRGRDFMLGVVGGDWYGQELLRGAREGIRRGARVRGLVEGLLDQGEVVDVLLVGLEQGIRRNPVYELKRLELAFCGCGRW